MTRGCVAVFGRPEALETAVFTLRRKGLQRVEVFSPFALPSLQEDDPRERESTRLGRIFPQLNISGVVTLTFALAGCFAAFGTQWLATAWASPYDAGGRPLFSWPAYIPITFVFSILCGGTALFLGTWWILRLPEPYHPFFDLPSFRLDEDRFHLFVPLSPAYERVALRALLEELGADEVVEVAA